ncbi:MAG: beta-propeller fold lactonase family protein, partial [Acidobacteriaceae bacterium]
PLTIPNTPGGALSTIYSHGSNVYIANTATNAQYPAGSILPFTIGPGGVLQTLVGGTVKVPNVAGASTYPDALLANSTGQFLYVANFGPSANPNLPSSNISPFTIDPTTHQLTPIPATPAGAYTTGAGPIWMASDSTNQYLYTVNFNDNTISAKVIDATHGQLSNIIKGKVQTLTVGQPTFVVISGRTF